MGKTKKKDANSKKKFVSLLLVIVIFTLAFIVLIKTQQSNTYYNIQEDNFYIKPEYGKTIVARDTKAIYPKYYVVYVNDGEYSIYVFNYYETISQYNLEFNRLMDDIVDYNAKDKMIRYFHSKGYGTYFEVMENLSTLVENDNIVVY